MPNFRPNPELVTVTYEDGSTKKITVAEHIADVWNIADQLTLESGEPDTLRTMQALCAHILFEQPVPKPLRDWFLDGIEKHEEYKGEMTLDEIFGYRGKENTRNVYTKAASEIGDLLHDMEVLLWIVKMPFSAAARLVVWRSQASVAPASVARKYREKKPDYWIRNSLEETTNWHEFDLTICNKYLNRADQLGLAGVKKDIERIEKYSAEALKMSPDEYYKFITTSQKAD